MKQENEKSWFEKSVEANERSTEIPNFGNSEKASDGEVRPLNALVIPTCHLICDKYLLRMLKIFFPRGHKIKGEL